MIYRRYYTVAKRCEFYVRVVRTISREHKIDIFELTCNVFLLYRHTDDGVFDDFPKISEDFSEIVPKARRTFPNIFQKFSKIAEDF